MGTLRNHGSVIRGVNGYIGNISIEGVVLQIVCSFWSDKKPHYIWVKRMKEERFDVATNTFNSYDPKPFFECYANKTKKPDSMAYRGEFMFVGFKYNLAAWFEDKTEKQLNFEIERSSSQPIIERLNVINKNKKL